MAGALQYLESQKNAQPELAEWYNTLADLYQRKLWHQLTLKLEQFVALAVVQAGDALIQLYHNFITDFETKINLLKLAHFAVIVSRQYSEKEAAISYLEGVIEKLRATKESRIEEPVLYVKMQIAAFFLEKGNQKECKNLIEDGKSILDSMTDVDPSVHASLYWVSSQYHKSRQEFAGFYKDALLYLAYTNVEALSATFKLDLAFDLSLAALLGDNIYNFGELLSHPIVNSLVGTNVEWLYHILQAFNTGNLIRYQELCHVHNAALSAQPALVQNEKKLLEKINILCLMEIIFSRPSEDRTIPLSAIAERTKLSIEDVEYLLMKSLSVHLIEGVINQVEGTVHVSWVQPRVLGIPQIKALRDRLDDWVGKVRTALVSVEAETPDLAKKKRHLCLLEEGGDGGRGERGWETADDDPYSSVGMNVKQDVEPPANPQLQPPATQPQRRPRGFAATAAAAAVGGGGGAGPGSGGVKGRKEREKEKERTKLRERHRRAITSRMLAGFRQYGNFPLPARADMNDVLAALAREAGWTVDADGTTYRASLSAPAPSTTPPPAPPPPTQLAPFPARSIGSPLSTSSLKNCAIKSSLDCQSHVLMIDESLSPASLDSVVVAERDPKCDRYSNASPINSPDCVEADQLMQDAHSGEHDNDFSGTPYIPVYVMLPTGVINSYCQLVDPEAVRQELRHLKSLNVDGVVVDCWWGIVEGWSPQKYSWSGYRDLFNIIREFKMKLQVVMAFHECGVSGSADMPISLPKWVLETGKDNQDIFFTDREGRRNTECLSWGIDKQRALRGRTAIEVYFDFMRSFRMEFDDFFTEGLISAVEIGLGASGELKFPSFPERMGWRYPGIGEFQCYDKYLQQSLRRAAKLRGHSFWARGPDNAGHYNSQPHETGFFCDRGDYDSYYGRFFLHWYAQTLIQHADHVLSLANLVFEETPIIVKIPAVYWWYKTTSHAAELTAGFYNPTNQDGYSPVFEILKKHSVTLKFMCMGVQDNDEALADSECLSWQLLNSAWDRGLIVAGQNASRYHDRESLDRILETAKPRSDPDRRHFNFFVYQQPSPAFMQRELCLPELNYFIKNMHGEASDH